MNLYTLLTNVRTGELILNLSLQIMTVSILGWIIMKIWKPKTAPSRSAGYLAVLISLAALPVFTVLFDLNHITWFQSTIQLPHSYENHQTDGLLSDIQNQAQITAKDNFQQEISKAPFKEPPNYFFKGNLILISANLFGTAWIVGFILFILRLGFRLSFLQGYMQNLSPYDNERLNKIYYTIKHVFKDRPVPEVYFSSTLSSPVTIGIVRPKVILPLEVGNMTDDDLKSVLLHELAHVFHHDNFVGFLQHVLTSLFWWNPLIYFINSAYSDSREDICDNYAINVQKSPKKYANTLLNLAEKTCVLTEMPATTGMSLSRRSLEQRVLDLLCIDRDLTTMYKRSLIIIPLIVSLFILSFGSGMKIYFQKTKGEPYNPELSKIKVSLDSNYRINLMPGENWEQRVSSNDFVFYLPDFSALIVVRQQTFKEKSDILNLPSYFRRFLYNIKRKHQWKDIKIVSEGETSINRYESYYAIFEYMYNNHHRKDKAYFVKDDHNVFLLRYSGIMEAYDKNILTFEEYVKSFEIVSG